MLQHLVQAPPAQKQILLSDCSLPTISSLSRVGVFTLLIVCILQFLYRSLINVDWNHSCSDVGTGNLANKKEPCDIHSFSFGMELWCISFLA